MADTQTTQQAPAPRLKARFEEDVLPALMERFGYTNVWEVPRPRKVSLNMSVPEAETDIEALDRARRELALIAGQAPAVTRAKKSISNFGIRQGQPIGLRVTLRGARMWEFIDRLFNVSLARIRDFRGLPADAFDGRGNYSMGIEDELIFPELTYDDVQSSRGLDIAIVTTAQTDEEARELLTALGLPLARG
ncbi:MAG: 50S ribosomal protein L5 [candidate division WS1 bacterium]|jgi:large subunit ribosomal protein L5|nr:50S ribosomal protein L5 [candidate division WS1 bacterium]